MMTSSNPKSLKTEQREARAARILQAAQELLLDKGYHAASMDEIAAHVGISKGTLYLHFKSKEALLFVLIAQEMERFIALMDTIMQEPRSVRERIERILLESYRSIRDRRQFLVALSAIGLNKGLIRDRFEQQVNTAGLIDRLTSLFEEGKSRGEFATALPTSMLVLIFLGLLEVYSSEPSAIEQMSPDQFAHAVSRLFFHGLLAGAPR
ncbi:MAG TPA: TetR/AcrR family transcriptional regulator [Aggregatilineales bacterium]|jgi:AcrR family transcriptional regulator|nr:TetR/AcrR family transcriptional regulator [Aggregatilineales bacterium]